MSNSYGKNISLSIFGESHGPAIGGIIHGLPSGIKLDMEQIAQQMDRRRPGTSFFATKRQEQDQPIIQSGLNNGYTTGAPLCFQILNTSQKSADYTSNIARPGHADYVAHVKYKGFNQRAGGGHFSGRLTAPLLFYGAICEQIIARKDVVVKSHIKRIGSVEGGSLDPVNPVFGEMDRYFPALENEKEMKELIGGLNGDSVGGIIEAAVLNVPVGLGEPFFASFESELSRLLFSIPAVKGVEFGAGFELSKMQGSQANDSFYFDDEGEVKTKTNHNGGLNGGVSNGMPIIFRVCIKPTPSIFKEQETIDLTTKTNVKHTIKGRHDPCIVPRAAAVVEACAAIAICDLGGNEFWI